MNGRKWFATQGLRGLVLVVGWVAIMATVPVDATATSGREVTPDQSVQGAKRMLPVATAGSWPHEASDLAPDPQVTFGRLANGFRFALMPNGKPKDRTRMHLVVRAGSLHESDEQRGIAHFLEHMLFNGSTHFPPGALIKYFQKIGMAFGPDANARTGFYDTVYDINLPLSDRQSLKEALQVMQDYAEGALLLASEIDRERGIILAEKRARDSADYRAYVASLNFELAESLFPDRLPIGTEAVIRSADREVFTRFYDSWYRPDNMILIMVGDFDPVLARRLVEEQFAAMAARAPAKRQPETGKIHHDGLKTFYHHEAELGSTSVTLQVLDHTPNRTDNAAWREEKIEAYLADQIIRNRLNRKLNQAGSPVTDASAGSGVFLRQVRYGYVAADCEPDRWAEALMLIEQELRQALEYGFTSDEIERVKKDYLGGLELAVDQAATRENATLARELIHAVSTDKVFRSPQQEKGFAEPIVAAASGEDLLTRLRDVWNQNHRLVLVTGNAALGASSGDPEDEIAAVFHTSQAQPVAPPAEAPAVAFPYLERPQEAGRIAERREHADIGVSMVRFENDIRVNFKPTDYTVGEVQFVLSFGKGRSGVPAHKAALAAVAEEVVNGSGLDRLDKETLAQAMAGKKTEMQFHLRDDRFTFEGRTVPEELELMFQLLQAHITDAVFREDAWQLALSRYRQTHLTMRQSVDGSMNLWGWHFLSGNDPRFGMPAPSKLDALSAGDMEDWVGKALRRGAMELSVVGDVDRETVIRLAARYLASLPDRRLKTPAAAAGPGPVFPDARQMDVPVLSRINKALLVMAFPTDDVWDIGRTRRLNILAEIVSERLRVRVRENLGAAYSPGAYSWPSRAYPDYGLFIVYIPLETGALGTIKAEVRTLIRDLQQNGITSEELQRALEPTLTGIKDSLRENRYWLQTVLVGASRHPVQLDWSRTIASDYAGIRKEDIEKMARQFLDLSRVAVVQAHATAGP